MLELTYISIMESMSSHSLNPFSYTILALVGEGGAGPHDLVRMMRRGSRVYWATSESHFYAEPKRLEKLGYLTAERAPGRTRPRTHYMLTDLGREALRAWAREPTPFTRIQSEAVVRLVAGDIVGDDAALRASLAPLRRDLDEIESGPRRGRGKSGDAAAPGSLPASRPPLRPDARAGAPRIARPG